MVNIALACDLDGTLIKHNDGLDNPRSVLKKDKERVERLAKDHLFIVSTGRNKISTFNLFEREAIELKNGYYITSNGAKVYDCNKECIYEVNLENEVVLKVIDLYIKHNKEGHLSCEIFDGQEGRVFKNNEEVKAFNNYNHIVSICVNSNRNEIKDIENFYHEAFNTLNDVSVLQNNWYVDVIPQNISKASAIKFILDKQEKDYFLAAVGDSYNDIPMFEIADKSYTFNNSDDKVKVKADYLIDDLYECIDDLLESY